MRYTNDAKNIIIFYNQLAASYQLLLATNCIGKLDEET